MRSIRLPFLALVLCLGASPAAIAQSAERVRETWKGPDASLLTSLLRNREKSKTPGAAAKPSAAAVKFTPSGDAGVEKALADAFGRTDEERAAVAEAFRQIKQGYETEVAKEGKSHNLAAAMAFFIAANVAAYHQSELPSDAATETLFQSLQETMAALPAFARLSNAEKQQMHDWLVCMGGFVLTGYTEARQGGDRESLKNFSQLADYSMRLVLGVDVGRLSFAGNELAIKGEAPATPAAAATGGNVVGVWSKSGSSPVGMAGTADATQKQAVYAGYYKGQYHFKADGTYTFKAERRGASTSQGFWTTEENGAYTVSGDTLIITPRASKMTLRSLEGVVQKTQNNPLERVTYKWQTHYFEGLNETQLVLRPPSETTRDGGFSQNSLFPNAYLYSPGSKLEWRF